MASDAVELFFSYSHKDEALRDQLATHLKLLERQGIISSWHDRKIVPGSEWAGDINHYLSQADIILLLVSADFLASDYCWDIEIQKALARHDAGDATVIPVILRPVDWSSAPFARLQAMPKDAQPVVTWNHPDSAFMDIARGIRLKAEELVAARRAEEAKARKQESLEQYRQQFKSYLATGEISFIARENLRDLAQTLGLEQADIDPIEAEETAIRDAYLANLDRYGQTFRRALDHEHPLSESTRGQLRERQVLLNLEDSDVKQIEERVLRQWQAEQVAKNQQALEAKRQQELADAEKLRQHQLAEERREQERQRQLVEQRLQRQKAELEEQRRQQEAAARQEQERQRQAEETARRAQYRQQEAAPPIIQPVLAPSSSRQAGLSRRRALQLVGFGGGGLVIAVAGSSLFRRSEIEDPDEPPLELKSVDVEHVTLNPDGSLAQQEVKQVSVFREDLGDGVGLDMVQIPGGEFDMGSPPDEEGRTVDEGPQHRVSVPSFFMGQFPVTQAQYEAVMGNNPSRFTEDGANRPVEQVTWNQAIEFCEKLSQQTGRTYRLPSEAEWEYACRAGTTTPFHFGETISTEVANYNGNFTYGNGSEGEYREKTTPVDMFPSNAFGLYDMHGNVWEWCQDVWHQNYGGAPTDGSAWIEGGADNRRLLRGGSWGDGPSNCRSAYRVRGVAGNGGSFIGFRVVCSSPRTLS